MTRRPTPTPALRLRAALAVLYADNIMAARPNIILSMADDLDYAALGCYGQKLILYTPRFGATGPLQGKKRFLHEGGLRVPMIARWPGEIQPAQTGDLPAAGRDLVAAFAELAGVTRPAPTPACRGMGQALRSAGDRAASNQGAAGAARPALGKLHHRWRGRGSLPGRVSRSVPEEETMT